MIELDGSYLEGGGQIVRTALALSAITQKPFRIYNIRAGREKSGLKAQHQHCIKALKELCNAHVEGSEVGSEKLTFIPRQFKTKTLEIDIGTAGSITLLLQSLLPPCTFADKKIIIRITGGTDVRWSPQIDYLKEVILPFYGLYANIDFKLLKRGYYPEGKGQIEIRIQPKEQRPELNLTEQGKILIIKGVSHASLDLQDSSVSERQAKSAEHILSQFAPASIRPEYCNTPSTGSGITVWAKFTTDEDFNLFHPIILGADKLGEKGIRTEQIGEQVAERLKKEINSNSPIDEHLGDNLIPLLGLVKGKIRVSEISQHTKTNIWVTEEFLDVKFKIEDNTITL